ncbi:hypothetical protein SBA4_3700005 [Candidatus Sulfopaludibacter sp. SbA4]|nr:hypothetical protein SBA4_3700005 [Candidatus Sulfopaludibacter sp. SbA4]
MSTNRFQLETSDSFGDTAGKNPITVTCPKRPPGSPPARIRVQTRLGAGSPAFTGAGFWPKTAAKGIASKLRSAKAAARHHTGPGTDRAAAVLRGFLKRISGLIRGRPLLEGYRAGRDAATAAVSGGVLFSTALVSHRIRQLGSGQKKEQRRRATPERPNRHSRSFMKPS